MSLSPRLTQAIRERSSLDSSQDHSFSSFVHTLMIQDEDQTYWQEHLKTLPYAQASIPFLSNYLRYPVQTLYTLLKSEKVHINRQFYGEKG